MYKIGIVGHCPDVFSDSDLIKRTVETTVDLLRYQYGEDLIFNIAGNTGVSEWAATYCNKEGIGYHLYMPLMPEHTSLNWYQEQKDVLLNNFKYAHASTICWPTDTLSSQQSNKISLYEKMCDTHLIDNSNFIIAFWENKHQGRTFNAIKYALSKNILILNGLGELRLITNNDIKRVRYGRNTK